MQALCGNEAAGGGMGRAPTYLDWGAIDVTSGWIAACGILVGLYGARRTGVRGAIRSQHAPRRRPDPEVRRLRERRCRRRGSHPRRRANRIRRRLQDLPGPRWRLRLALAVPDSAAWSRLREAIGANGLPADPPPLRTSTSERQPAETFLEGVFGTKPAAEWVALLDDAGVPAAVVLEVDRADFVAHILDDATNRQLGRVTTFEWGEVESNRWRFRPVLVPVIGPGHPPRSPILASTPARS